METLMNTQLTRVMFEQNLNSRFWLRDGDGEQEAAPLDRA